MSSEDETVRVWLREAAARWEESGPCELPPPPAGLPPVASLELRPVLEMSDIRRGSMTDPYEFTPPGDADVMYPVAFEARVVFSDGREVGEWIGAMPRTASRASSSGSTS